MTPYSWADGDEPKRLPRHRKGFVSGGVMRRNQGRFIIKKEKSRVVATPPKPCFVKWFGMDCGFDKGNKTLVRLGGGERDFTTYFFDSRTKAKKAIWHTVQADLVNCHSDDFELVDV